MDETFDQQTAELPESFLAEFNAGKTGDVQDAMIALGNFVFEGSSIKGEGDVVFRGKRSDGTTVEISFHKGSAYKSPAELEAEGQSEDTIPEEPATS